MTTDLEIVYDKGYANGESNVAADIVNAYEEKTNYGNWRVVDASELQNLRNHASHFPFCAAPGNLIGGARPCTCGFSQILEELGMY